MPVCYEWCKYILFTVLGASTETTHRNPAGVVKSDWKQSYFMISFDRQIFLTNATTYLRHQIFCLVEKAFPFCHYIISIALLYSLLAFFKYSKICFRVIFEISSLMSFLISRIIFTQSNFFVFITYQIIGGTYIYRLITIFHIYSIIASYSMANVHKSFHIYTDT